MSDISKALSLTKKSYVLPYKDAFLDSTASDLLDMLPR